MSATTPQRQPWITLHVALALQEAENGIRVNVVSPGIILVDHHVKRTGQDPKTAEGYACKITDMHQCHKINYFFLYLDQQRQEL